MDRDERAEWNLETRDDWVESSGILSILESRSALELRQYSILETGRETDSCLQKEEQFREVGDSL